MSEIKKILGVLGILLALGLCALILSHMQTFSSATNSPTMSATKTIVPPQVTPAVEAQLAASKGFQHLISYTGEGFIPSSITIKKDETVRFTNNSATDLWIAATGASGTLYPASTGAECGESAFDSCRVLKHGEFWEFTFTHVGTWSYQNNNDAKMVGVVTVK